MSLEAAFNLHQNTTLRNKTLAAITAKARYTLANAANQTAEEIAWARKASVQPQLYIDAAMWAIANNTTIQGNGAEATPDGDIEFVVNAEFPALVALNEGT